jgi:hypothetical protein
MWYVHYAYTAYNNNSKTAKFKGVAITSIDRDPSTLLEKYIWDAENSWDIH